jgi:hypothetical protein
MIRLLNPDALVPSADTVKNDIIKNYEIEKKKIETLFQVISYIIIYK